MPVFDCHTYLTAAAFFGTMRTQKQVQTAMQRFGLDAVALVSDLGVTCDFAAGNRQVKEVVDAEAGIFGFVTLNAEFADESIQEQRTYLFKREFVGSVLVAGPGEVITLSLAREVVNAQRRYTKPVALLLKTNEQVAAAKAIAEEFNQMKFLWLGMAGDAWRPAVEVAKRCLNVHLEISGNLDVEKVAHAATAISARRIHFGSGLPYGDPNIYRGMVEECETLTTSDRNRIFFDNALALFQINAEVE